MLRLELLAFDGTRMRANNRKGGVRTPERLREMREELAAKSAELEAELEAADARDAERLGGVSSEDVAEELADVQRRRAQVDAALEEIRRVEEAGETLPGRIPLTDPESRFTKNKDGGFAPNFPPLATGDVDRGLIVSADGIAMTDEGKPLLSALEDVKESFEWDQLPPEVLADGMMARGENLADLAEQNVTLDSSRRMASDEAKTKSDRRRHTGEFPFAIIKEHFGAHRFLLRGLANVQTEWLWLSSAFNLTRRFRLMPSGADPPHRP